MDILQTILGSTPPSIRDRYPFPDLGNWLLFIVGKQRNIHDSSQSIFSLVYKYVNIYIGIVLKQQITEVCRQCIYSIQVYSFNQALFFKQIHTIKNAESSWFGSTNNEPLKNVCYCYCYSNFMFRQNILEISLFKRLKI